MKRRTMASLGKRASVLVLIWSVLAPIDGAGGGEGRSAVRVYWLNGDRIQRAGVDGSRVEDVVTGLPADRCEAAGCGLAVDSAGGKLYWTGSERGAGGAIRRANLDGSGIEDLVTTAADGWRGLLHAGDLALDAGGRKMYWVDWGHGEIRRAGLDGSGMETVVPNGDWLDPAQGDGFTLDAAGGRLYYLTRGGLRRARLDGSRVEDLSEWFPSGRPRDVAAGRLYLTYRGVRGGRAGIRRANLDGSRVEDLVTAGLRRPADLAVDEAGGKMYWTDRLTGKVQRANLDGSRVEDLVTGLRFPDAVALESERSGRREVSGPAAGRGPR